MFLMTSFIDIKYIGLLSSSLPQFKKKKEGLYNFRCPYCGDSQKSKLKARGYLIHNKTFYVYKCHNCEKTTDFPNLLKYVNKKLHDDYIFEVYKNKKVYIEESDEKKFNFVKPVFLKGESPLKKIKRISQLNPSHPVKKWIVNRGIPSSFHYKLFFCNSFFKWVNDIIPNKFPSDLKDHPRLVIPFLDENKKMFAFQGRTFGKEQPKYYTIKLNDTKKIYGLDTVNWSKRVYVVEGPIDSLFVNNCIATAQSDLRVEKKNNVTLIPDNEPRNREIVKRIESFIEDDYSVCLFPEHIKQKDINDMVLSGVKDIHKLIDENTYQGLQAKVRFKDWRKIDA